MRHVLFCLVLTGILSIAFSSPLQSAKRVDSERKAKRTPTAAAERTATPQGSKAVGKQTNRPVPARPTGYIDRQTTRDRGTTRPPESDVAVPATPTVQSQEGSAADIQLDWISINHGGATDVASGDLRMGVSIAQTVAGEVSNENLRLGLGFWYGTGAAGNPCNCPFQGDYDEDGEPTGVDLTVLIDVLFANHLDPQDPSCPATRSDLDNSGEPDALDLILYIDYLFANGPSPCDPCDPVQTTCVP
jgi:hypothetical protein